MTLSPYIQLYLARRQGEAVVALVRAAGRQHGPNHVLNAALRSMVRDHPEFAAPVAAPATEEGRP